MTKKNTKEEILISALDLFSKNGFEATSMSDIANSVGIRKASLYSHYKSKQDILDNLIIVIDKIYQKNSIFNTIKDFSIFENPNKLAKEIKETISYIVTDPNISKIRKLFTIEQYRNKSFARLQQKYSYDNVMNFGIRLIKYLIKKKVIINGEIEVMAAEFVLPISMWINVCDRDPSKIKEVTRLIELHIAQFYITYSR